jgi:DNA-binding NtrC family response regulator
MTEKNEQDRHRKNSRTGATFVFHEDGPMAHVLERIERFAPLEHPVLITGETGTGKEQVVRLLHAHSRRPGRLVSVNLSAIPEDLIESELFGHIRGAFTGADTTTAGYVERASEGTLFLDEIGEIPLRYQVKLLRLIQEGEFEKVGSQRTRKSTARFVFATNRNLEDEVRRKNFRADLYYRISSFTVHVPSLRDRKRDIPLLIDHFLWFACSAAGRSLMTISEEALDRLLKYDWPGNVRELENIIYRLVALVEGNVILPEHLPDIFRDDLFLAKKKELDFHRRRMKEIEEELFQMAMMRSGGSIKKAARLLGISRTTLQYRLKKAKGDDGRGL